jgi:hypothetical protein
MRYKMIENEMDLHGTKFLKIKVGSALPVPL